MLTGNGGSTIGYESGPEPQSNGAAHFSTGGGSIPPKRRDSSLNRENPFRDALQSKGSERLRFLLYCKNAKKLHSNLS